jgi:hypothetical protein
MPWTIEYTQDQNERENNQPTDVANQSIPYMWAIRNIPMGNTCLAHNIQNHNYYDKTQTNLGDTPHLFVA